MERITYRKTLDTHKNGIQFTLQGFETTDKMSRRIELGIRASGDTIDLPLDYITAMVYVTSPNATEPSINSCEIQGNTIVYDVLPIVEEGITKMQIKLIKTSPEGAKSVLASPRFAVEVTKGNADDEGAMQTPTFTALEDAVARANGVYESRLLRIELADDCMFRAYYADGVVYETDVLKELFLKGDALLSQSFAKGGTGVRAGEDTDNSMYYANVSKSAAIEADNIRTDANEILQEVSKHGVYTAFSIDFEKGEVKYISPAYDFVVNQENGELEVIGKAYIPEETIDLLVAESIEKHTTEIYDAIETEETNRKAEVKVERERIDGLSNVVSSLSSGVSNCVTNSYLANEYITYGTEEPTSSTAGVFYLKLST